MKDYLKKILNEQQYEASIYTDGASLILAGAGAGKTRTLTYKIAYMNHLGISSENILAVTFTNKAANEMKERLMEISKDLEWLRNDLDWWSITSKWIDNSEEWIVGTGLQDFAGFQDLRLEEGKDVRRKETHLDSSEWLIWTHSSDFDEMFFWEENLDYSGEDIDSYLNEYDQNYSQTVSKSYNWIWTFHSIFLKILKQDIKYLNDILWTKFDRYFNIADEQDTASTIRKILKELGIKDAFTPREVKWRISRIKNTWLLAKDFLLQAWEDDELIAKIYQKYEKALQEQNTLDFDDLLLLPYVLFKKNKDILEKWKNKFKYILVDEAQDTNKIQFELMYMLSWPDGNITLIWDDFQSIYGWRWAVIDDFLNAKKYWPNLKIFKLEINYRSKKTIVEAWNALIANNKNQYEKNIKAFNEKESKIKLISFPTDTDEAVAIVSLIKKLHKEKNKSWHNFAIIFRTNAQSEPFEKVLLTENIPYKVYGWFKFYERKEVKDILSYIKYLINPSDGISLARIINVPWRKIWTTTVDKLLEQASVHGVSLHEMIENISSIPVSSMAKNNILAFNELIKKIKEKIKEQTPTQAIETIVKMISYEEYLIKEFWQEEAQERMANIGQLMNVALSFSKKWFVWLREFIDEISLFVDLEEKQQEQVDQVQLMTVHASKWLEFDTVFLTWLEENIFPLSRARLNPKELEEERRLAYVGITRAKNNLFLTYAESRKQYWQLKYNPVSRFVEEIPPYLLSSFNSSATVQKAPEFSPGDKVKHKLFWVWEVLEVFQENVIVRFYGEWIRKVMWKMLERWEEKF